MGPEAEGAPLFILDLSCTPAERAENRGVCGRFPCKSLYFGNGHRPSVTSVGMTGHHLHNDYF
jgi:hypothetical protein